MASNNYTEGYLKGYEEGLTEAWNEVVKLSNRGLSSKEIALRAKSIIGTIYQKLDSKRQEVGQKQETNTAQEPIRPQMETTEQKPIYNLSEGGSYLVREPKADKSLRLFSSVLSKNYNGLIISRTDPQVLKGSFKEPRVKILWLTRPEDKCSENCINYDLTRLQNTIREFMEKNPKTVILIDGINYLVNYNNFNMVLRFIQTLRDEIAMKRCCLITLVDPGTIDSREYKLLEGEMQVI
jgi:hypothetical protein